MRRGSRFENPTWSTESTVATASQLTKWSGAASLHTQFLPFASLYIHLVGLDALWIKKTRNCGAKGAVYAY